MNTSKQGLVVGEFSDGLRLDISDMDYRYVEVSLCQRSCAPWEEPRVDMEIVANLEAFSVMQDENQAKGIVRIALDRRQIAALVEILKNEATAVDRLSELAHLRALARMREN